MKNNLVGKIAKFVMAGALLLAILPAQAQAQSREDGLDAAETELLAYSLYAKAISIIAAPTKMVSVLPSPVQLKEGGTVTLRVRLFYEDVKSREWLPLKNRQILFMVAGQEIAALSNDAGWATVSWQVPSNYLASYQKTSVLRAFAQFGGGAAYRNDEIILPPFTVEK